MVMSSKKGSCTHFLLRVFHFMEHLELFQSRGRGCVLGIDIAEYRYRVLFHVNFGVKLFTISVSIVFGF